MELGHNSDAQFRSLVERIENINVQIKELTSDRSDIFAEAKSTGVDVKVLRRLVAIRKEDQTKREEAEAILETYMRAMGMI